MHTRSTVLLVTSVLAASVLAQQQPPPVGPSVPGAAPTQPAVAAPRGMGLVGDDGKPVEGVRLSSAEVNVQIRGPLAEATMRLTFKNETGRIAGGELTFPLPEGATVAGYGLDINGVMVEGVAVEKQQARVIYEKEIRKNVDPGLVEHVAGNNFRTRLFPVPPNGSRTIQITYIADLVSARRGAGASFTMPLGFGKIDGLKIAAFVGAGGGGAPVMHGGSYEKAFEAAAGGYQLIDSPKTEKPLDELTILLPESPGSSLTVQKRLKTAVSVEDLEEIARGGPAAKRFGNYEHYFVLTDTPAKPAAIPAALKNHRVLIVWDASLSRAGSDTAHELKLLEASLTQLGHPSFDIALLRNTLEVQPPFGPGPAELARGLALLKSVTYDGATNIGLLAAPKNRANFHFAEAGQRQLDYDLAIAFTDGLGTVGPNMPGKMEIPVYTLTGDASANHALLRQLSQSTGGNYLNLKRESDTAVLSAIGQSPFALISVEYNPKEIADVSPGVGTQVSERVTVSGKLLAAQASVTLVYGYGKQETSRRTFVLKADGASEGSLLARFWATQRSAALSLQADQNRDELLKLGRDYNLVTPNTSLLVLETAEQYVMHRVVPPKNRPEVYQQFIAQIEQNKAAEQQTKEQKVQQVLAMWDAKTKWWETEFKYPKDLKVEPVAAKDGTVFAAGGRRAATAPADGSPVPPGEMRERLARSPVPNPVGAPAPTPGVPPAAEQPRANRESIPDFSNAPDFNLSRGGASRDHPQPAGRPADAADGEARFVTRWTLPGTLPGQDLNNAKNGNPDGISINVQPWDPNTPYLVAMKAVAPEKAYGIFLEQRTKFANSPAFYFDCADYLLRVGQRESGLRVLSDIAELKLEDARLLRIAAHRLAQIGETELAIDLFERVLKLRPEEPQSYRDLALALADRADFAMKNHDKFNTGAVVSDYGRALDLLNKVVTGKWDRFQEIEVIALMEANRISARLQAIPNLGDVPNPIDSRLRKNLDCDVRIVLTWDADQTDIDLWVTEPSGEVCIYNHNRTTIGGAMSHDFTDGYGPEEYALRKVMPGEYTIRANYFGSHQSELTGPCTVQATVITHFGRPNESRKQITLRLSQNKEVVTIGTVKLGAK